MSKDTKKPSGSKFSTELSTESLLDCFKEIRKWNEAQDFPKEIVEAFDPAIKDAYMKRTNLFMNHLKITNINLPLRIGMKFLMV
jgi:hypothetical protein